MKRLIGPLLVVLIIVTLLNIRQIMRIPVIGKVTGLENEQLIIHSVKYERDTGGTMSRKDKGQYLGTVVSADGKIKMRVYIAGHSGEYLYALWGWEGAIYKRAR